MNPRNADFCPENLQVSSSLQLIAGEAKTACWVLCRAWEGRPVETCRAGVDAQPKPPSRQAGGHIHPPGKKTHLLSLNVCWLKIFFFFFFYCERPNIQQHSLPAQPGTFKDLLSAVLGGSSRRRVGGGGLFLGSLMAPPQLAPPPRAPPPPRLTTFKTKRLHKLLAIRADDINLASIYGAWMGSGNEVIAGLLIHLQPLTVQLRRGQCGCRASASCDQGL